jgi:tetratricopeptide (TPR) repeat protein
MEQPLPPGIEILLKDLQPDQQLHAVRRTAAQKLGQLTESDLCIVKALMAAMESDPTYLVRLEAGAALQSPAHQQILQQYPGLAQKMQSIDVAPKSRTTAADAPPSSDRRSRPPSSLIGLEGPLELTWEAIQPPPIPVTNWRLALAVVYGLLAALALSYAWYLIGAKTNTRFGYGALIFGLAVGAVVSFMGGGNRDVRYSLLGAALSGVGIAFGEFLIFGRPGSRFTYEFDAIDLVIYGLALYEGWIIPRRAIAAVQARHHLIHERNRKSILIAGLAALALVGGFAIAAGGLPASASERAKAHLDRARELFEAGNLKQATIECEEAVKLKPNDAQAHALLGMLYLQQGQVFPGINSMGTALELGMSPKDMSLAYTFRGVAYGSLASYDLALADLDQAITADDPNAAAYYWRGRIHVEMGERDKAIPDLEKALALSLDASQRSEVKALLEELK